MSFNEEVHYEMVIIGEPKNQWVCHYCGCPAEALDHLPPHSRYHDATLLGIPFKAVKIPACHECNSLAGSELHISFPERAAFVKSRLAMRYARQLRVVDWTKEELKPMGYQFRVSIQRDMRAKSFIESRLNFHPM